MQTGTFSFKVYYFQTPTQRFCLTVSDLDLQLKGHTTHLYLRETQPGGGSTLATCQNLLVPRKFKIIPLPKKERSLCDHNTKTFFNLSNLGRQLSSSRSTKSFEN